MTGWDNTLLVLIIIAVAAVLWASLYVVWVVSRYGVWQPVFSVLCEFLILAMAADAHNRHRRRKGRHVP